MKRIRHLIEYAFARLGLAIIDALSYERARAMGIRLADAWFSVDKRRRKTSINNILKTGIVSTAQDAERIALESFRHFACVMIESLKSRELLDEQACGNEIKFDFPNEFKAALADPGQGIILASGHLGSWEAAAQLISRSKPVVGITRDLNNPYTNRLMQKRKPSGDFRLTPKHSADTSRFLETLKKGEILGFMIDQHARDRGMMIDFFGLPAATHTAIALLHLVTGAPIYFGHCKRGAARAFELKVTGPIVRKASGNRTEDIKSILEDLNRLLESAIRNNPEQYLWAHRRWR